MAKCIARVSLLLSVWLWMPLAWAGDFTINTAAGDVTAVGDCTSGACMDGTAGTAIPRLQWVDTTAGSDDFEWYAENGAFFATNTTDNVTLLYMGPNNSVYIPGLSTCTIKTTSDGKLYCGTDETGAGGGDPVLIDGTSVSDGSGVDLQGGAGIDITFNAGASPDTASFVTDFTEISSLTWGSAGNFTTMTFDAGAIDPVITAASGALTVTTGTLGVTGSTPQFILTDNDAGARAFELAVNGQTFFLADNTNNVQLLAAGPNNAVYLPTLTSCTGALNTGPDGKLFCGAGGSGTPGGSNTQAQYNNSGSFGGSSGLTLNATQITDLTFSAGAIASSDLTTGLSDETGSGAAVFASGPILISPELGAATATSIVMNNTGPFIRLSDSDVGGKSFEWMVNGPVAYFSNTTDNIQLLSLGPNDAVYFPTYSNCTLKTGPDGKVMCSTDETGAPGAGDITDVNEGTAIDVTNPTGPAPTVNWDSTEVEATTWGAGGNASNIWTFNLSGTDTTMTFGSGLVTLSHDLTIGGGDLTLTTSSNPSITMTDSDAGASTFELNVNGLAFHLSDVTNNRTLLTAGPNGAVYLPTHTNCPSGIATSVDGKIMCTPPITVCAAIPDVVSTDDNFLIWVAPATVTVREVGCRYEGTGTTVATFALEDAAGNAMTHDAPICTTSTTMAAFRTITANGGLVPGEGLRFDVTNTPSPTTDDYALCVKYTVD